MTTPLKIENNFLNGQLLMAMPTMRDPRFEKAVIFICAHDERGAMGIAINHILPEIKLGTLLEDLEIKSDITLPNQIATMPVYRGGPVETARGFLVHSHDFVQADTIKVNDDIHVTGTVDALMALKEDNMPENILFALGYAGWDAGQLEQEVKDNAWLTLPATPELIFEQKPNDIWQNALNRLGITEEKLSFLSGNA
jgi:putative transcriptional regulator